MRLKKPELALLSLTLLAFAVMVGFFLGRNTVAGPVRIVTRNAAQAAPPAQEDGTQAAPSSSGQPLEESGTRTMPSSPAQPPEESAAQAAPSSSGQPPEEGVTFPVDLNTATAEELQALPGIGETRAAAIVAYREEHGPFTYVEDLLAVSGIGEGILANMMDYITVGEQDNGKNLSG